MSKYTSKYLNQHKLAGGKFCAAENTRGESPPAQKLLRRVFPYTATVVGGAFVCVTVGGETKEFICTTALPPPLMLGRSAGNCKSPAGVQGELAFGSSAL
ncbi:MAG TPA: hypothetical protein IAC72_03340 [Candidatus Fimimonas merdipullorum]|uniref:Uncharacterized protein n=1 Tax=Candidatus Fimimonas merdipullorum TaxID=2840822 RepID=A0A9D1MXX2_9BACT|nr:hypothetical protein [Candidatus Fimimonas merdipullorum]